MEAYAVILYFATVDVRVAVGPMMKPTGYSELSTCRAAIPLTRRKWLKLGLPVPDSYSCERIEIK